MIREETNVAERVGPMVHAHLGERPGFAPGLKSKVLDYWARRVGLWSNKITLFQQFVIYASVILGLAMVAVCTWVTSVEPHDGDLFDGRTIPASWLIVGGSSLVMLVALCAIVYRGSTVIEHQKSLLKRRLREQARLRRTNSQLEKKMRDALRESARIDDLVQRRLGAELHDGPAQLVALVLLRLDEIGTASEATSASTAVVNELRRVASDALKDIRSISHGGSDSLVEVLETVISAHGRRTNSVITWSVSDIPEHLPIDIIRCVGRVV